MMRSITIAMKEETPVTGKKRHGRITRLWHWINAVAMAIMLMSGFTIFNAHPRLYWGKDGTWGDPAWFQIGASNGRGLVFLGDMMVDTTGFFGRWQDSDGRVQEWGFPEWITIPARYDLSEGRQWHFLFAWILALSWLAYMARNLTGGHFRRDLLPSRQSLAPRSLLHDIRAHLDIAELRAGAAHGYNPLQRLSYIMVVAVMIPLMILTGLAMSPGMNTAWPWLPDLFGGRQSARSVHFVTMLALFVFVVVHLAMVLLAGPFWLVHDMVTGGKEEAHGEGH